MRELAEEKSSDVEATPILPTWERGLYQAGGGHASVHFIIFGEIPQPLTVSQSKYRIGGVPDGIDIDVIERDRDDDNRIEKYFLEYADLALNKEDPPLFHAVRLAQSIVVVKGTIRDPKNLNYLRDVVGIVACVAETGGQAVLDVNSRKWFRPERWRALVFNAEEVVPGQHVAAYVSQQGRGPLSWVRTRGMVTFGRPDVSVRDVPPTAIDQVLELCGRFTKIFAMGAVPTDGQQVKMQGFSTPLRCKLLPPGSLPDSSNSVVEIKFPLSTNTSTGNTGPIIKP